MVAALAASDVVVHAAGFELVWVGVVVEVDDVLGGDVATALVVEEWLGAIVEEFVVVDACTVAVSFSKKQFIKSLFA